MDNPTGIAMDGNKVITGTFTQEEYTLNVSVDGEGSVAKDPDQPAYLYGAWVSLTATADPGWSFAGWSGDLSETDNPAGITMDGNKVITGTFTQDEYTLNVSVDGEGSVAKGPDQPTYLYGESVSLTATADPGWSFAGWSGDLSGSTNPDSITMDASKSVTATFSLEEHTEMGLDLTEQTQAVRHARRGSCQPRLASPSGAVGPAESRDVSSSDLHSLTSNSGEDTWQGSRSGGGVELGRQWDLVSPSQRRIEGLE
jgi:uncharacterized repeat protein (TIGR02543 family)